MSWSEVVWLVVAVVAGYWIVTSGIIKNLGMGSGPGNSGGGQMPAQNKVKTPRTTGPHTFRNI
jgi:hypothetical protein